MRRWRWGLVTADWRKVHYVNFYITRIIKARGVRVRAYSTHGRGMHTKFLEENLKERIYLDDQEVVGIMLLNGSQINRIWGCGLDQTGSAYSVTSGCCGRSVTVKRWVYLDMLSYCQLLQKDLATWILLRSKLVISVNIKTVACLILNHVFWLVVSKETSASIFRAEAAHHLVLVA